MDNIPIVHETPEKGEQVELQSVDYSRASARPQYTAAACGEGHQIVFFQIILGFHPSESH